MVEMVQPTPAGSQTGMAYLAFLIVVMAMGAAMAATGTVWHEVQRRERERDLLYIGECYRRAIGQYFENTTGVRQYPPTLDALLLDTRSASTRRYLRRLYRDPITNSNEWGLVRSPQGGIMGVYSLAKGTPIKQANFPLPLASFENKSHYADWQFLYVPPARRIGF